MGQFKTNDIFQIASRHYSEQLWVAGLLSFADFQRQLAPPDYMNWCDIREILSLSWQDAADTRSALITCRRVETDLQLRCHDIQVFFIPFLDKKIDVYWIFVIRVVTWKNVRCMEWSCKTTMNYRERAIGTVPQRETFQRHLWIEMWTTCKDPSFSRFNFKVQFQTAWIMVIIVRIQ